ncbi:MAG TPA: RHS repeat-associated core domain-containing protein, partial [Polyangiaceae bacterium]|nr:RHS repeat-associated core domain-containing protein [Polyangiaceae bacterium]
QYRYGAFHQLKEIDLLPVDGTSPITTLDYDVRGRRIAINDADAGRRTFVYNGFDEIESAVDAKNSVSVFEHDALGRLKRRTHSLNLATESPSARQMRDALGIGSGEGETFTWDVTAVGFLASNRTITETGANDVTKVFSYNVAGQVDKETWKVRGDTFEIRRLFGPHGRLDAIDYPATPWDKLRVEYDFDAIGQTRRVWAALEYADASIDTWDQIRIPIFAVAHRTAANEIDREESALKNHDGSFHTMVTTREIDPKRGWTNSITSNVQNLSFDHDANGNLVWQSDSRASTTELFLYDDLDMLRGWSHSFRYFGMSSQTGRNYRPRPDGTLGSGIDTYTYSPQHVHGVESSRRGSVTKWLSYDANGDTTFTKGQFNVVPTSFGLPRVVTKTAELQPNTEFFYDADHARVVKDAHAAGNTIYIGDLYERRTDGAGNRTHVFYLPGPERIVAEIVVRETSAMPFGFDVVDGINFHDDSIGSVDYIEKWSGQGTRFKYSPYGERINPSNADQPGNRDPLVTKGFTFHEMDDDLKLINMKGRMFDPSIGRFLTPDPHTQQPFVGKGLDRYSYAFNNPFRYVDPTGFDGSCVSGTCTFDPDVIHGSSGFSVPVGGGAPPPVIFLADATYDDNGARINPELGRENPLQSFHRTPPSKPLPFDGAEGGPPTELWLQPPAAPVETPQQMLDRAVAQNSSLTAYWDEHPGALGNCLSLGTCQYNSFAGEYEPAAGGTDLDMGMLLGGATAAFSMRALVAAEGAGEAMTTLYRGVMPAELESIGQTGRFINLGSAEGKYFSTTVEGVSSYARGAVKAFGDPPYTLVTTQIPTRLLTPQMGAVVDRGIQSFVIPDALLPGLTPTVQPFMVVPLP